VILLKFETRNLKLDKIVFNQLIEFHLQVSSIKFHHQTITEEDF